MNVIKKNLPNLVTCINLLAGCTAVALALTAKGDIEPGTFNMVFLCIAIAAVADFCDGLLARLLHAYSDLGKELDSLCDLVSFGVAPAAMVHKYISAQPLYPEWLGWVVLFIPLCAALRLARFNVDTTPTTGFRGMPVPANAIFWIGLMAYMCGPWILPTYLLATIIICESLYMVSSLPMLSLKFKNLGWKDNSLRWLLIVGSAALIVVFGIPGLFWVIVYYAVLSAIPVRKNS